MTTDQPPSFERTSAIELQSVAASKIIAVSLYSSRAEVTRLYKIAVKTGLNQVNISGLPNVLETESLRVEGRGAATIHDVTVSTAKGEHVPTSSPELTTLLKKKEATQNALARCQKSIASLEQYLASLTVEHVDFSKVESIMDGYNNAGEKLDARQSELVEELRVLDADIESERKRIAVPHENDKLRVKAAIGVFAEQAGDIEIALIYAVPRATWKAFYDIRVDMNTKDDPIKLIYKAGVTQNTGESWDDVPLTLETSTPTFGLEIPELQPWNLDVVRPAFHSKSRVMRSAAAPPPRAQMEYQERAPNDDLMDIFGGPGKPMDFLGASVTSKGNVSATFRVPGRVSIPSDGEVHNFTLVELKFAAVMSWVAVPKIDTKAHITARITNASDYTLLAGTASVYVDGSFISRSEVPAVSPKEAFDCPLGVDPSIRITYHPVIKKTSQSGLLSKTLTHTFSQRITIFNTKSLPISRVKIIDHIPASQNAQIEVKLVSPALLVPSDANTNNNAPVSSLSMGMSIKGAPKAKDIVPQRITLAKDVVAQWDGVDEPDCVPESLGLDRKVNWICAVGSQAKVTVGLEWEVTVSPASLQVTGL
ncbi:DH domain-containing protein [Mycena chlorophos]|uniref:DH domain-containing protein n=1 Tax=Mycena chlorophos TaxID=658473 RepID=A0A8H6TKG0_MYCCL|nr:DH domain-containing protein [Mycena chlorophos]